MKTKLFTSVALASIFALTACETASNNTQANLANGITKVETVVQKGKDITIPYTKYKLDNGLTIVLHPDNSDPLVHVDITYHVGSGREEAGKSGFAHFFEHMMFQGSDNVKKAQHFGLITESGGTLNGSTNTDRTNYYETVPSNQLERMLWLESDRMGFFLDAVTVEKFENQRETVKNERGQNYDNRPYGLLRERVNEALYPEGHPYSWLTIGYLEDLDRANLDDLKKFFLRWYGPNNATLTIGGDFNETQTLDWIKQYFGGIPRGPEVADPVYSKVTLDKDRYISMEDNVSLPLIQMSFPTVHANHPDEAPLDVLMSVMGSGKTSILYKNMVKRGKAVQASAGQSCGELSCAFTIMALPTPGNSLAEIEKIARASLLEFESRGGATDDDLVRVKAGIVSGMIYGLESVSGKVRQLAAYETYRNNPNAIGDDIRRYENVTKADVMRVYNQYIKNKPAVIMSIVPNGKSHMVARADTWSRYQRNIPTNTDTAGLVLRPGTSNFDRSVIPSSGPNPNIKVPNIYKSTTANGIKILGAVNSEVPTTTIRLRIPAGQTREPLSKLGLASLTSAMMDEGTQKSTAEDISNALQKLGSSVSFSSNDQYTTLSIRTLTKNLGATLAIANEKLTSPKFTQSDFTRLQKQTIEGIKNSKKNASTTANNIFNTLLFGENNSFAQPNGGLVKTVQNLTLADVQQFYANNYGPKDADLIVVSNLGNKAVAKELSVFTNWQGGHTQAASLKSFPKLKAGTLYLVDKPGAAQSQIRIGKQALPYDTTGEYYRAGLMNYALGGAFTSRINLNLREEKGYTYGARSSFSGNDLRSFYSARAGVRANSTTASIVEFKKEISNYQSGGLNTQEVQFTKASLGQRDARAYETPSQKLGFLSQIATYDLSDDFIDKQNAILANISPSELNALATKHLKYEDMILLVVGDKAKILSNLKSLGHPIVELDADGHVVK